jgi:hypothetical protein
MAAIAREPIVTTGRIDTPALANAAAAVAAAAYVICRLLALIAPDALRWIAGTWFHGLALASAASDATWLGPAQSVVGLVTVAGAAWLAAAATGRLYNGMART